MFDDQTYLPGERVDSTLNLTMFGLTYGYSVVEAATSVDVALTFGIQVIEVEANAVVRSRVVRDAESGVTPLPLVGIEGRYDFNERWSAEARLQYLSVEFDEIDGSVMDARAAVTWRMNPYLVFGLGYRIVRRRGRFARHRHAGPRRHEDGRPAVVHAGQPVSVSRFDASDAQVFARSGAPSTD